MPTYRALYRKYRPVDFDDVWGQNAVTDILKYEVEHKKLSHAYLFCGSRGTGKTSCAKILAKAVNCLHPVGGNPCNRCEACLSVDRGVATDVIEMDAASNNGVDNVRDLKDEIAFTPANLAYRVYIIDEVHMMSQSAFNALLKTLEEPPPYVIFILATTEFHKLPSTIVSRCQRFDFLRIPTDVIMGRLRYIAQKENIALTDDAARMIARSAAGGMRDAVSLLELCSGAGRNVDADVVAETVGADGRELSYRLLKSISASDYTSVFEIIRNVVMSGADICAFLQNLTDAYRDMAVAKTNKDAKDYLDLTDAEYAFLSSVRDAFSMTKIFYHTSLLQDAVTKIQRLGGAGRSVAELTLMRMCDEKMSPSPEAVLLRMEELEKQMARLKLGAPVSRPSPAPEESMPATEVPATVSEESPAEKSTEGTAPVPYKRWLRAVEKIGDVKRSLSVQFKNSAAYSADGRSFVITMSPFFAKRLTDSSDDAAILRGVLADLEGCAPGDIRLDIRPMAAGKTDFISELADTIGNQ